MTSIFVLVCPHNSQTFYTTPGPVHYLFKTAYKLALQYRQYLSIKIRLNISYLPLHLPSSTTTSPLQTILSSSTCQIHPQYYFIVDKKCSAWLKALVFLLFSNLSMLFSNLQAFPRWMPYISPLFIHLFFLSHLSIFSFSQCYRYRNYTDIIITDGNNLISK